MSTEIAAGFAETIAMAELLGRLLVGLDWLAACLFIVQCVTTASEPR